MIAREKLAGLRARFGDAIRRADLPGGGRMFVTVDPAGIREICRHVFRDMGARYVISIGADDRPYSGAFLVAHNFAFDGDGVLCALLAHLPYILL